MQESGAVEKVFLERNGVRVTNARFQVGAQTYAMAAVNSVAYQREDASLAVPGCLGVCGAVGGLVGLFLVLAEKAYAYGGTVVLLSVGAIAFGIFESKRSKPTFLVKLRTASGEVQAVSSPNRVEVEEIVRALNDALVARG